MELSSQKNAMRRQMRAVRKAITTPERKAAEDALCERLYNLPAVRKAHVIATYQAIGSEASVHDLVRALRLDGGRIIAYPAIHGNGAMSMVRVEHAELPEFIANPLAIVDQASIRAQAIDPADIDLLLVPGLAFDERRRRLGQGGGYYDRFLEKAGSSCLTIGIAFDEQIVDEVPCDVHDRAVNYVVTPTRIIS